MREIIYRIASWKWSNGVFHGVIYWNKAELGIKWECEDSHSTAYDARECAGRYLYQ